jgi:Tetratricopeptide repeat
LATSLSNLADLLLAKGDESDAELLYRQALAIDEKALGSDHPNTQHIRYKVESLVSKSAAGKQKK